MAPIRFALFTLALVGAAAGLGCDSISDAVMDPCSSNRKALQLAENKISGLRARNVDRQSPVYRMAVTDLKNTQHILVGCQAVYGDGN